MRKYVYVSLLLMLALTTSCINTKKMVVMEDMKEGQLYPMAPQNEMKIQRDDRLNVVISSRNRELAVPFNINGESFQVTESGNVATPVTNRKTERGYIVDPSGKIELPILGKIHAEGLTCRELQQVIRQELINRNLISDPLVLIDVLNLKITVMGEVMDQKVINVTDSRITLLEALTMARGLTANARPEKVAVIREEGDGRKVYMLNIRSSEILNSPCYYLQQNDVVYVHPLFAKADTREDRTWRFYSLGMGVLSLILSITVLLK